MITYPALYRRFFVLLDYIDTIVKNGFLGFELLPSYSKTKGLLI